MIYNIILNFLSLTVNISVRSDPILILKYALDSPFFPLQNECSIIKIGLSLAEILTVEGINIRQEE